MRSFFAGLFASVHLVIFALFSLGLFARYVHPDVAWWLQPIALALPAAAVLLCCSTAATAFMKRWILAALGAGALLLFASRFVERPRAAAPQDVSALTVVSFNTGHVAGREDRTNRGMEVLDRTYEPDFFSLQEFPVFTYTSAGRSQRGAAPLLGTLGYNIVHPDPPKGQRHTPPIGTKLPVEQSSIVALPSPEDGGDQGVAMRAQLTWAGRSIVVYNVHLASFTQQRPWRSGEVFSLRAWLRLLRDARGAFVQRAAEAETVRAMVESEDLPVLVCGDLNTTPHQWAYSRLAAGFTDAFRAAGGFWGPTFPARLPLVRIDFILADPSWTILEAEVGPQLSPDHRPLIARLRLQEPAE